MGKVIAVLKSHEKCNFLNRVAPVFLEQLRSLYEEIEREGDCLTIKDLAVNGRDLIQAGITPGPQLGLALQQLLEIVLEDPEKNTREYLLSSLPKET